MSIRILNHLSLACISLFVLSCGGSGGGGDLQGKYSVNDINILADDIEVGETVRVEVFFETKTEGDGTPDGVEVIVRVPTELAYVIGSAQIYDGSTDNSDTRTPDFVERCDTGETFLTFFFDDSDLFDREVGGFGQFGLRFEALGVTPISSTLVGASAGDREDYTCGVQFPAEENEAVQVLR